jgi:hypothetical protein
MPMCKVIKYIFGMLIILLSIATLRDRCWTQAHAEAGLKSESDVIDIDTLSKFHVTLEDLCFCRGIEVAYDGPLGSGLKSSGIRLKGMAIPCPFRYSWSVRDRRDQNRVGSILFRIRISLQDNDKASYLCRVNEKTVYVSIVPVRKCDGGKVFFDSADPELRDTTIDKMIKGLDWTKKNGSYR